MTDWKNRIVEYGQADPADLLKLANPLNPRRHPDGQTAAVEGSLNEVGWVQDVVVNRATGRMLDGHLRVKSAVKTGQQTVPVKYVDLTEAEEALVLATLDYTTGLAEFDDDIMKSLLSQLDTDEPGLRAMLEDMREEFGVNSAGEGEGGDTEPEIDKAEELRVKWSVEPGQLWALGDHRLICGDCTDPATVARVMGGEGAALVVTDPPYGVSYADKNKWLNAIARGNRIQTEIENDHASKEDTQAMWKAAFKQMAEVMQPGAVVYCFMPQGGDQMMMMMMMMMGAGIEPRHELIWLKNNHVLGRVDYAYKHEPILYAWKEGGHKFYGDFQTSILEFPKPQKSDLHPTMKPVPLLERLISNSSQRGDVVYDMFSGSGSTLIAAHNLGRKFVGSEIDPGYVGVILERWSTHSGLTPALIGD